MAMELAVLSFVCAALLSVFFLVRRTRISIPHLAIVLWLFGFNLIHGVNAVLWAGNVDIHIPVWCDIVTKLMLGADIAVPGALLCIVMQLELLSSYRMFPTNKQIIRNRMILEIFLCYAVPMLYMALHLVVQDRRFDLVRDYGCSASTHSSTFAFLIIWIPPLAICILVLVFAGICIHNIGLTRGAQLTAHLEARSTMNSSSFTRQLATCMTLAGVLLLISLSSLFTIHSFNAWTSWSAVHVLMSKIEILQSDDDIRNAQLAWWAMLAVSGIYTLLSFIIGEEGRDVHRWIVGQVQKKKTSQLILPLYSARKQPSRPEVVSHSKSLTKSRMRPLTLELRSGWDDLLDDRKRIGGGFKSFLPCPSPTRSKCIPTSVTQSSRDEDQQFMASTLCYLGSPTAQSLGIASPLQLPPTAIRPSRGALCVPLRPQSPPAVPMLKPVPKAPKNVPEDVVSTIDSVFDASWPVPPVSPATSLAHSYHSSGSRSPRSHSDSRSSVEKQYHLYHATAPLNIKTRPFESSSVSSAANPPTKKAPMKRLSILSLHKSWRKEQLGQGCSTGYTHDTRTGDRLAPSTPISCDV